MWRSELLCKLAGANVVFTAWDEEVPSPYTVVLTNSVAQEPEGSSPHSQQPATGPCPETVESNPHPRSQSP
jgi:hypothetical protein